MESELELAIAGLVSLGYNYEVALKSTSVTQSSDVNKNVEWIQAHLEDPEIKALLQPQAGQQKVSAAMEVETNQQQEGNKPEGAATEVKEGETQPDGPKWAPISDLVDKALVEQLNGMGFSKNVAEKALFFTQEQKSIEAALAWTESHQDDDDYEEALMMQVGGENKPKLSEAEAKQKARELQAKLREDRKKREQQDEFEKEKRRILSGKNMGDAQRDIQELKQRQDALQLKKQREQDAIDKQKILDQLQRDKEERFGKKAGGAGGSKSNAVVKEPTTIEKFEVAIKQVKIAHPRNIFLDKAQVCLQTLTAYLNNIANNPTEEKFRKINQENKAFQSRVAECFGAKNSLLLIGFVEEGGFLVNHNPDIALIQQALQVLQKETSTC